MKIDFQKFFSENEDFQSEGSSGYQGSQQPKTNDDGENWWEERSLPEKIVLGIFFGILGLAAISLFGFLVKWLWNWLMPDIFGLKEISYWQAWGLLLLSSILFKNWGSGSSDSSHKSDRRRKRHLRQYIKEEMENEMNNEFEKEYDSEEGSNEDEANKE